MKEQPIIFNTEMVQTILDDRKSQTRRVIKPQPQHTIEPYAADERGINTWRERIVNKNLECPYGKIGDKLWVRETWYQYTGINSYSRPNNIRYFADDPVDEDNPQEFSCWIKKPSIFMSRIASRITLEITNIRVERLQDISECDCYDEGCQDIDRGITGAGAVAGEIAEAYEGIKDVFIRLWDSINAKRGYLFKSDPWVWVIEFKRV